MIIWPAVCLWSIVATEHAHKHSFMHSHPLQQQLYLNLLCVCVQCSMFMDVVQMVTSHCQAQSLPSPPVPRMGSSGTSCGLLRHGGRKSRFTTLLAHTCTCTVLTDEDIDIPTHVDTIVNFFMFVQDMSTWCERTRHTWTSHRNTHCL